MFGYVNINKAELKVKDFYQYKAYYCGLCRTLKKKYGRIGQMTLSYDMTFLILLLTSLYESCPTRKKERCLVHPVNQHYALCNEITEYVADMNIALSYHHLMDDWNDEKSMAGLAGAGLLKRYYKKIYRKYPKKCQVIQECLIRLKNCETQKEQEIDLVSRCFGELMSELFVYRDDIWADGLRKMGFFLGKFIYILDAYDDLEKDRKNDCYNPLLSLSDQESFDADIKRILTMMMAECTREFEKLPCLMEIDILRNILYAGVWTRYEQKAGLVSGSASTKSAGKSSRIKSRKI